MMRCSLLLSLFVSVITASLVLIADVESASAQGRTRNRPNQRNKEPEYPPLPADQRLLALHKKFVDDAEKLAAEYERGKDLDKAIAVYKEIIKLVPQYETARQKLASVREKQGSANRTVVTVRANQAWQPAGVIVEAGKPVIIRAEGSWTFKLSRDLDADGIEIPEELRDFPLGSLVAVIDTGNPEDYKPFVVGRETAFDAKLTGRLLLRMYDVDPADNEGVLKVQISGTFKKG